MEHTKARLLIDLMTDGGFEPDHETLDHIALVIAEAIGDLDHPKKSTIKGVRVSNKDQVAEIRM